MVIDKELEDIDTIHEHRTLNKIKDILNDKTHPFYPILILCSTANRAQGKI